jgi:hypothetical protein
VPSSSPKQAKLMRAVAHGWKPPKSSGIKVPVSVAKEFVSEDQRKARVAALRKKG